VGLTSVLGLVAVTLGALAPEAVIFLGGEEYELAAVAVAPLAGGMLAFGLFSLLAGASGLAMRTKDVALASIVGLAIQVGVALFAVPVFGLAGAGFASLAGYAAAMILLLWWTDASALTWPMTIALTGSAIGLLTVSYLEQMHAGLALRLLPPVVLVVGLAWLLVRYRRSLITQPTPT
jgi:O-antigen/teichoic acid export membrane protein